MEFYAEIHRARSQEQCSQDEINESNRVEMVCKFDDVVRALRLVCVWVGDLRILH